MILVVPVAVVTLVGLASKSDAQSLQKTPKVGLVPDQGQRCPKLVGLQVTLVFPESPAAQKGMEIGDVIVAVNGLPVRSQTDLTLALTRGGRVARLEVLDCRTGSPTEVAVNPIMGRIGVQTRVVPLNDYRPLPPFFGFAEQLGQ
jgi:C-terminal processing protease CtpA/Prc